MSYDPGAGDRSQPPAGQGWPGNPQYQGAYGQQQPPQGSWGQQPTSPSPGGIPTSEKGGIAAIFDFSFSSFATPSLIRLLYIVGSVLIGLFYLFSVGSSFYTGGAVTGLFTLIIGAVVALFSMALLRVSLEFYYAVVRMSEDIHNRR